MAPICKGYCKKFKGKSMMNGLRYENGQKRCTLCNMFLNVTGRKCPCCSTQLRTKPRTKKRL